MRKSVKTIGTNAVRAFMAALLVLAVLPVAALAESEEAAPSAAVAEERIAWAKKQTVSKVGTLVPAEGGATDASVRYFQKFKSDYSGVARTFEYRLVPLADGNPMPENSEGGLYAWTFTGDDAGWINIPLASVVPTVTEGEKVFYYVAYQHIPEPQEGYTYDDNVFWVEAHVLANGKGVTAVVRNSEALSNKLDDPGWTVLYQKPEEKAPEDPEAPEEPASPESPEEPAKSTRSGTYASSYTRPSSYDSAERLSRTGDETPFLLPALLGGAAAAVLVAATLVRMHGTRGKAESTRRP